MIGLLFIVSSNLHIWFPSLFPESARLPLGDAFTTVCAVAASILLIQRKTEALAVWLVADLVSTGIYLISGVFFLAAVYIIYAVMDLTGFILWSRRLRCQAQENKTR